jgi:hypothetical protein
MLGKFRQGGMIMDAELLVGPPSSTSSVADSHRLLQSDEVARQAAFRAQGILGDSPYSDVRQVVVEAFGPRLVISGRLESYYHKQLVQEALRFAYELLEVIDDLQVYHRPH